MRDAVVLLVGLGFAIPAMGMLRVSDARGKAAVTRVDLSALKGQRAILVDLDGDHTPDTVKVRWEQTGYRVYIGEPYDEVILTGFESEEDKVSMDIASAYVAGNAKPALLVYFTQATAMGDHLVIIDVLRTTMGLEPRFLFDSDAGFADGPVVVTPGMIEIRHFRGWLEAKYLWDGKKYIGQKVEE
jgi:hypothetical protein